MLGGYPPGTTSSSEETIGLGKACFWPRDKPGLKVNFKNP